MGNKNKPDFNFFFVQELDEVNLDFFPRAINTVESDDDYDDDDNENNDNEHVMNETEEERVYRLLQSFEFSQNNDQDGDDNDDNGDEEEDSIRTVKEKVNRGCGCHFKCYEKFQIKEIIDHIFTMRELNKDEKEMYIMGKLKSKSTGYDLIDKKRRRYMYNYDDREICKHAFLLIHDIGEKRLKNIAHHLKQNGPIPRSHGNKGRKPNHALKFDDIKKVVNFVLRYGEENGLPLPAVPHANDFPETPILLPASTTKTDIHSIYKTACEESHGRAVELSTFKGIWLTCTPHIKIASPRSDVCSKCEKLRCKVTAAVTEEEKSRALDEFKCHIEVSKSIFLL